MRFYKPADGWAADVIPFFWDGEFHLFYLKDRRDEGEPGVDWAHVSTRDFVRYAERPLAIPRGGLEAQDRWVYTGCVLRADDRFHIFYTGHNSRYLGTGRPQEAIMRAVSDDLIAWTKDEQGPLLFADPARYEVDDWRDPFVFWNEEAGEYWMLLAARLRGRPTRRAGCLALAASPDLTTWTLRDPFWAPALYTTHECPDLFRMGDWWYLVYSEYSDRTVTRYRMSRDLRGPWRCPPDDAVDARAFYAAKTVSDGERRYLCGWNPTRVGERDDGPWQWGGQIVVHELVQAPDGTLRFRAPEEVRAAFAREERPLSLRPGLGSWRREGEALTGEADDGCAACRLGPLPDACQITLRLRWGPETSACGLLLRVDEALDRGYELRWEPRRGRLLLDRWPRKGDAPIEIERPVRPAIDGELELRVIVDGTLLLVYADDAVALSGRLYDHQAGAWGAVVAGGAATFAECALTVP